MRNRRLCRSVARRSRSSSRDCVDWNIEVTIAPAWQPLTGSRLHLHKRAGRIARLAAYLEDHPAPGTTGIGHTRWATHGPANDRNAHPHLGGDGVVAVVHNGVIENYAALKRQLQEEGLVFHSDTDTEVIAHLIASRLNGEGLIGAVSEVLPLLKGTYGLAAVSRLEPGVVVGAGSAVRWFSASAKANVFSPAIRAPWPALPKRSSISTIIRSVC